MAVSSTASHSQSRLSPALQVPEVHQSGGTFAHIWTYENHRRLLRFVVDVVFILDDTALSGFFMDEAKGYAR